MTREEYNELKAAVDEVALRDVHTGRVLHALLDHVGDLAGVRTGDAVPVEEEEEEDVPPTPMPPRRSRP